MSQEEYEQYKVDMYNSSAGNLNEKDGWNCDACKNKGYISVLRYAEIYGHNVETLIPCKCQKTRNALAKLNRSGLKDAVSKCTFDKYETPEPWNAAIKEKAQNFCKDETGQWFFIGGQSGAGKTHICTAIAVHFIRQGKETRYMVWPEEIQSIQAAVNDGERYTAIMKELQEADVLYIDDLFKHGKDEYGNQKMPTPAETRRAFEIVNYRYNSPGLLTIISSERTLAELNDIDEALAGRIAEKSKTGGYCISLKKDSSRNWRMKGIQEV